MSTPQHAKPAAPRVVDEGLLTKRETEVLESVALGNSSKEVAEALVVSKRTVDFHLANIYKKLGTNNRVRSIIVARERNLIQ